MVFQTSFGLLFFIAVVALVAAWWKVQSAPLDVLIWGGVLAVWVLLILSRPWRFLRLPFFPWDLESFFPTRPTLLVDTYTWIYGVSLVGFAFSCTLLMRRKDFQLAWVLGLVFVGMLGVFSENALTLLMSWTLMDILWITLFLLTRDPPLSHGQFALFFVYRMISPLLLIYASFNSFAENGTFSFLEMGPKYGIFILGAAIFRLVFWFPSPISTGKWEDKRGLFIANNTVPAAVSLSLLTRAAEMGIGEIYRTPLLTLAVIILFICAILWWLAPDQLHGAGSWTMGIFTLSFAAGVFEIPRATFAWGLALILSGNILYLGNVGGKLKIYALALLILGLCGLPFTPLWVGDELFSQGIWGVMFGLGYGFLFWGALRFFFLRESEERRSERSSWFPVIAGFGFLFLTQFLLGAAGDLLSRSMNFWKEGWWFAIPYTTILPLILLWRMDFSLPNWVRDISAKFATMPRHISSAFFHVGRIMGVIIVGILRLLEGRGGVIWSLIGVFFLLSLLALRGGG